MAFWISKTPEVLMNPCVSPIRAKARTVGESTGIVIFWFDDDIATLVDETIMVLDLHGRKAIGEKPAFACLKILHN